MKCSSNWRARSRSPSCSKTLPASSALPKQDATVAGSQCPRGARKLASTPRLDLSRNRTLSSWFWCVRQLPTDGFQHCQLRKRRGHRSRVFSCAEVRTPVFAPASCSPCRVASARQPRASATKPKYVPTSPSPRQPSLGCRLQPQLARAAESVERTSEQVPL